MHVCPECGNGFQDGGFCPQHGTALADNADDNILGETIGSYRVARLLGTGGMGRVYLAVHPNIGSRVAIKVLARDRVEDPGLVQRFFDEARSVNVIRHESIVNVLDLATLGDGRPYIVMEYLDGAALSAVIKNNSPLPIGGLARAMTEVLDALHAAHATGVIHRDLKPDNIFVSPSGRAKVLDFGIAKLIPELGGASDPTRTGSLLGTPHYMSPEQTLAKPVDSRADLYSCGVILFEGVTGQRPFQSQSLFDLMRKHLEEQPPPPRSLRPDCPAEVEAVILRAMKKQPAARFSSAREMAGALMEACRSLPPEAWAAIAATPSRSTVPAMPSPPPAMTPRGTTGKQRGASEAFAATVAQAPAETRKEDRKRGGLVAIVIAIALAAALAGGSMYIAMSGDSDDSPTEPIAAASFDAAPGPATTTSDATPIVIAVAAVDAAPKQRKPTPVRLIAKDPDPPPAARPDAGVTRIVTKPKDPPPPKGSIDPSNFDPSKYVDRALSRAVRHWSDATFVRLDVSGVYPDGHADLTLDDSFSALYRFISPSRAGGDPDQPIGVRNKNVTCVYYVNVDKSGVRAWELKGWSCDDYHPIPVPKCSMKQIWRQAIKDGAPGKNAVASFGYWGAAKGSPRWHFSVDGHYSGWIDDDC